MGRVGMLDDTGLSRPLPWGAVGGRWPGRSILWRLGSGPACRTVPGGGAGRYAPRSLMMGACGCPLPLLMALAGRSLMVWTAWGGWSAVRGGVLPPLAASACRVLICAVLSLGVAAVGRSWAVGGPSGGGGPSGPGACLVASCPGCGFSLMRLSRWRERWGWVWTASSSATNCPPSSNWSMAWVVSLSRPSWRWSNWRRYLSFISLAACLGARAGWDLLFVPLALPVLGFSLIFFMLFSI